MFQTQDTQEVRMLLCYSSDSQPQTKGFPGVSGLWVSAGCWWLDSWYATQLRNVLVITRCSRFTSLTRNMTGLIVGFAEEGLCKPLQGSNGIQQLTCKMHIGCLQPHHFMYYSTWICTFFLVHHQALISLKKSWITSISAANWSLKIRIMYVNKDSQAWRQNNRVSWF